jgi:hypothetical protein
VKKHLKMIDVEGQMGFRVLTETEEFVLVDRFLK